MLAGSRKMPLPTDEPTMRSVALQRPSVGFTRELGEATPVEAGGAA
jgi:hypothetical protein